MYEDLTLLSMAKRSMDWVAQRQQVLADNIANSDTPGYVPKDVKAVDFSTVLHQTNQPAVLPTTTDPRHIVPKLMDPNVVQTQRNTYESSPDGNAVILEEQMAKMGDSKTLFDQVTALFQKNVSLIRTAITGQ